MRKSSFLLTLLLPYLALTPGAHASGGDGFGNGGGLAEQNLAYAYLHIEYFVDLCSSVQASCKLTQREQYAIGQIRNQAYTQREAQPNLEFRSEKETPGFFFIDGNVRIAKTGDRNMTPIFINRDLIYTKDAKGDVIPIDIPSAVGVLVHEMGHHVYQSPLMTHEELDVLGAKVKTVAEARSETVAFSGPKTKITYRQRPSVTAIDFDLMSRKQPDMLVSTFDKATSIYEDVKSQIQCSIPGEKVKAFSATNLHWTQWNLKPFEPVNPLKITLRSSAFVWCSDGKGLEMWHPDVDQWLEIDLQFTYSPDGIVFDKDQLIARLTPQG